MTRTEFLNDVTTISELMSFVYDNGIEIYDTYDITDSDCRDSYLDENIVECAHNMEWRDLLSSLERESDNDGYAYYIWDEWENVYRGLDDDALPEIKEYVLELADENDVWDHDDDDEEEECDDQDREKDEFEIDTDITIIELFASSVECMTSRQTCDD